MLTNEQVQEHLDAYYYWFVKSDINAANREGIRFMIGKWDMSLRCRLSQDKLNHIDHSITLSWQHARELEEMAKTPLHFS